MRSKIVIIGAGWLLAPEAARWRPRVAREDGRRAWLR
jgi:hypothetical protein